MKFKKPFYFPGSILLIGFPILLCFFYFPESNPQRLTPVVFVAKYIDHEGESFAFDTTFLSSPIGKRKYLKIKLDTNNLKAKLDSIRGLSRYLIKFHDTIDGIHIVFDKNCRFETFIQVIGNFRKDSVPIFAPFENNIWVFYNMGSEITLRKYLNEKRIYKPKARHYGFDKADYSYPRLLEFILQKWPISVIFLILLTFTVVKLIRNDSNSNRKS
jgi:hypothetical protein